MYKRIYYDYRGFKVHLWETINGQDFYSENEFPFCYYIPDKTGQSEITDIYGNHVIKTTSRNRSRPKDLKQLGIKCCESDIGEPTKFLHERYKGLKLKADLSIFNICGLDIEVDCNRFPDPDIAEYPINLITVEFSKTKEVITFGTKPFTGEPPSGINWKYVLCEDEQRLLDKCCSTIRKHKIDILTGWNIQFDLKTMYHRARRYEQEQFLSPIGNEYISTYTKEGKVINTLNIGGVNIIDYMEVYKSYSMDKLESYSLNFVAMHELGEGKLEFEGTINQLHKTDWNKFVLYNIQDVLLLGKLDEELKFIELLVNFAYQALIPIDKALSTVNVLTGTILRHLRKVGKVLNDRPDNFKEDYEGAYNYTTDKLGLYKYVISKDMESLYPNVLMLYNVSPETLIKNPTPEQIESLNLIKAPVEGVYYRREKGILPIITKTMFDTRKLAKTRRKICDAVKTGIQLGEIGKALRLDQKYVEEQLKEIELENGDSDYYEMLNQVNKKMVNSMYGVMGNDHFHFYDVAMATTVTLGGQKVIKYITNGIRDYFLNDFHNDPRFFETPDEKNKIQESPIVLIDTDSCYINLGDVFEKLRLDIKSNQELIQVCTDFEKHFFEPFVKDLFRKFSEESGIDAFINFKLEKIMTKLVFLATKRYVSEYIYDEGIVYDELQYKYVGVEVVRSSTPKFCREHLKDIIEGDIFNRLDKNAAMQKILQYRRMYLDHEVPIENIAYPRGINKYSQYAALMEDMLKEGITYPKGCQIHVHSAIAYNYMVEKLKLPYQPVTDGDKLKYVYVNDKNEAKCHAVAFIGKWPVEFNDIFVIDYEQQFEKSFVKPIQQFFEVLGWGKIAYEVVDTSDSIIWD